MVPQSVASARPNLPDLRHIRAVDLFAGAGGWDVAAEALGIATDGIEIMAEAQATRAANGLKTLMSDVRDFYPMRGAYDMVIGSPPCQSFSVAGGGAGRRALDAVLAVVASYLTAHPMSFAEAAALTGDERTALVVEPLRVIRAIMPTYVVLEQVPTVLPVWRAYAHVLTAWGYSVVVDQVNAEQHGVPQTRKRAILVARRDGGMAALPTPTHSRFHVRDPWRLDAGVLPWVSMAEALGWQGSCGFPRRADRFIDGQTVELDGQLYRARDVRDACTPAQTVSEKARSWCCWVLRNGNQVRACERETVQPAGTLFFGARLNTVAWHLRSSAMTNATVRRENQPGPTLTAGHDRAERVWMHGDVIKRPLAVTEAAVLQSFPENFTFSGSMTKQFLQIGNAVPPVMALAILTAVTRTGGAGHEQLELFSGAA